MTELARGREDPPPRWVPAALSFVAGYVDVYTFLALFGLFVAQVTAASSPLAPNWSPMTPALPARRSLSSPFWLQPL